MTRRRAALAAAALMLMLAAGSAATGAAQARVVRIAEYRLAAARLDQLRARWVDQLLARHPQGTWAPMRFELSDRDLALMGLPPRRVLIRHRYSVPTAVYPDGRMVRLGGGRRAGKKPPPSSGAASDGLATYAGTGFFGIRPGAWLLSITNDSVGWCSMAHVYGSPGAYQISTAGHCGKTGDVGTVIGAVGHHSVSGAEVPVLLDFGKFAKSTGDAGIGKDWALISVDPAYQSLVSPTMAFWGGPFGIYTRTGEIVSADLLRGHVGVNPDPMLVQQVVHYGHGAGIGAGGTPRTGTAITWRSTYFTFFGAITPGDSGSGTNTVAGDPVGSQRQAAGINTHIYVDGSLKTGVGLMAGTRATSVTATLANGQLVPYPAPVAGAP